MRESAQAAQSWVWAHARQYGIDPKVFADTGVHIHVPAGSVPKDGPSAGVALVTALTSLYAGATSWSGPMIKIAMDKRSSASASRSSRLGFDTIASSPSA